jgi:signal transduction histidine kinase
MSFRLKVVLWFSFALLISLVAVHLATVEIVRLMIYDELDSSLEDELTWMRDILATYKARGVTDEEIRKEIRGRSSLNPRKEFITVRDADGNPYFISKNLEEHALPQINNFSRPITSREPSGREIRLIGIAATPYSISIGYSLAEAESSVRNITGATSIVLPVAVLFAFIGGLFLVGHFIRPVNSVNKYLATAATYPLFRELPALDVDRKDEMGLLSKRVAEAVGKMRTSMRWILSYSSLVPHQLRTPVAVIRSQLENAMHERTTRVQLQEVVASTYDEVLKLNDTIENLLTLGKLQAGTLRLRLQKLRIRNFLEGFKEEAAILAGCKNIQFVVEEGPDILLTADMQWIRQALFNLLDNAIRHTPEGGQIAIRYAIDGAMIDLQVVDTGEGIAPGEIPWLFEPFFQGEYREQDTPGTGLGLALVKLIATAHHGSALAASIPGRGATFTLSLPLKPESDDGNTDLTTG